MEKIFEIKETDIFEEIVSGLIENLYFERNPLDIDVPHPIMQQAKSELKEIMLSTEFDLNELEDILKSKSQDTKKVDYIMSLIKDRYEELTFESILDFNSETGNVVVEFDWSLKMILGTSSLKTLTYPAFHLALKTSTSSKKCINSVYELKKDVLLSFIKGLEQIDCSK